MMMRDRLSIYSLLFISICTQAQETKLLFKTSLPYEVDQVSVDRLGGLYLFGNQSLMHLDTDGKILDTRDTFQNSNPIIFETWNPLRIWIYDGANNRFQARLLDHFLDDTFPALQIDSALAIEPIAIIPGNDNHTAWVMDLDYSVKFIELLNNKILSESEPIFERATIMPTIQFRAHQGFLFILTKGHEILVVSRTGKIVKKIKSPQATWLGVLGEDIYFHSPGKLTFIDIYTGDSYTVPVSANAQFVVATDERIFEIENKELTIFHFNPKQN